MTELQSILEKSNYTYDIIQHEKPILSKQEGIQYFGIEAGQTAPALILNTDKGYIVLIVSGSRSKVNFEIIADLLSCSYAKLASPEEVQNVAGFQVGSVRIIGLDLPCVIDKRLFDYAFIYGGTGHSTYTLKIEPQALNELNEVIATFE
ncbi:YbaK/EbsC family protein [Bacillus sp. Bva_UNVM-123]|uniref:aminoacyl-tRNA deacylase n=1 Tax=Bacillus sp. Bva_UNVM-123 TaxID=2829798 RepID=UPI00391EE917